MIPLVNISNASYSWGSAYESAALAFQAAQGGCTIAMVQSFWGQTATVVDAWPVGGVWSKTYPVARQVESESLIMMIDVEPPQNYPHDPATCLVCINNTRTGGTYGVAGTNDQIKGAQAFVGGASKFSVSLPDLRGLDSGVSTTVGSMYNILPGLGNRRVNEYTYRKGGDAMRVSDADIIGLAITLDGRGGTYTPEEAMEFWPGRDKMLFPIEETIATRLALVNRFESI
jgi:hypothetical protein